MKYVIYLGVLFMPDRNAAAQRAAAISSIIEDCGYVPVVVGMDERLPDNYDILNTKKEFGKGFYYLMKYPQGTLNWLKITCSIRNIVKVIQHLRPENIQSVIAMDYFSLALMRLMHYCKRCGIPFVVDTVDWFQKSKDIFPRNIVKDLDTAYRMKVIHKKADCVIAISRYLYDYYEKSAKRIVMIPGVIKKNPIIEQEHFQVDPLYCNIAFVGSPGAKCEKERIDWIIAIVCNAAAQGKRVRFYVAGVDKNTLFKNRQDIAAIKNFDDAVVCLGRISHTECIQLVSACDFATIIRTDTLLSRAGFPTKLGEAFSCGTPVIVTPTSNIVDFIPDTHGIVAEGCTEEATEQAILKALECPRDQVRKMKEAVRAFNPLSAEHFTEDLKRVLI